MDKLLEIINSEGKIQHTHGVDFKTAAMLAAALFTAMTLSLILYSSISK